MNRRQRGARIVVLAVVLMASALVVYAGGQSQATAAAGNNVSIVVRDNYPGAPIQPYSTAYIEENTNTKITWIRMLPDELQEKLNLLLAAGDRPEVVQFYTDAFEHELKNAGLLLRLNDLLDTKMQNLEREWGESVWQAMTHADGGIYAIPAEWFPINVHFDTLYRKDWLDRLGLRVPVTIEDYFQVAVAVATQDPDGNGRDDTYAMGNFLGFRGDRYFDHVFGAYGTHALHWIEVNGRIVNGSVLPGAKEALRMMKRLYDAGAIDPEFITDDEQRTDQKFKDGVYGATNNYIFMMVPNHPYDRSFRQNNPNGVWVQQPLPLTSSFGAPIGQRMNGQRGWLKTAMVNGARNIDAAARVLDWLATDEGAKFYLYGIPGEDYTEASDGTINQITQGDQRVARSVGQLWLIGRSLPISIDPALYEAWEIASVNAVPRANDGLVVPEITQYQTDLDLFTREQFLKMTVGEIPIDGGFERFVEEWNARGGRALTDALNRAAGN